MVSPRCEGRRALAGASPERLRRDWLERPRLVGEIIATYIRARRALARAPIAAVVASLRAHSPGIDTVAPDPIAEARHLASAVVRTLAMLPGDTRCLVRSLVLTQLLARRGIPTTLVIGARAAPDFLAHAWVEHDGQPVLYPGDGSLGRLVEL